MTRQLFLPVSLEYLTERIRTTGYCDDSGNQRKDKAFNNKRSDWLLILRNDHPSSSPSMLHKAPPGAYTAPTMESSS